MTLDIGPADFVVMLADLGRTVARRARTANGTDDLGNPVYDLGSASNISAIVQDVRSDDKRVLAGILQPGDKQLYVTGTVVVAATDELTIDGLRYRTLESEAPSIGDTPTRPYRGYLIRRVAGP